ncbi:MAG: MaoC/PaaZ C-terminal domain-containing protein [Microthrixaceae bacterium]
MTINPEAVGTVSDPVTNDWASKDSLLYAVGVGAGQDPVDKLELPFTTENSNGITQRALPTMAVVLPTTSGAFANIGSFNPAMLVHGEESITWHREIPVEGSITSTTEITAIWDKGKGAVVEATTRAAMADEPLFDLVMSVYIRGEGGWGGERGPSGPRNVAPDREADHSVTTQTRPEQALIYRLTGDRNPLHSDPTFAAMAGFDRPILHGLCTYGFAGRVLLHELAGSDPAKMRSIEGRFASPVMPGEALTVRAWEQGDGAAVFNVAGGDGRIVIDAGRITYDA